MGQNDAREMLEAAREENIRLEADNRRLEVELSHADTTIRFLNQAWANELARNQKCGADGGVGPNAAHVCKCVLRESHGGTTHRCALACGRSWATQ